MKLVYLLVLLLLFFAAYFSEFRWISWIIGLLILLIVVSGLFSSTVNATKTLGKELTRDMETDMEKAHPKPPSSKYLTSIVKEAGKKTGEFLAPEDYSYKAKNPVGRIGKGAKNFLEGLGALFSGKEPSHHKEDDAHKAHEKPHAPAAHHHPVHKKEESNGHH